MATNTHVIFEKGKMASEQLDTYLVHTQAHADLDNGSIVTAAVLVSGEKDIYTTAAPTDVEADEMFIVHAVRRVLINGKYAMDMVRDPREFYTPLGLEARARKLMVGDTCKVSLAGFESAPTVGQYVVPANTKVTLTPSATIPAATLLVFKVLSKDNFDVGGEIVDGYELKCVKA